VWNRSVCLEGTEVRSSLALFSGYIVCCLSSLWNAFGQQLTWNSLKHLDSQYRPETAKPRREFLAKAQLLRTRKLQSHAYDWKTSKCRNTSESRNSRIISWFFVDRKNNCLPNLWNARNSIELVKSDSQWDEYYFVSLLWRRFPLRLGGQTGLQARDRWQLCRRWARSRLQCSHMCLLLDLIAPRFNAV